MVSPQPNHGREKFHPTNKLLVTRRFGMRHGASRGWYRYDPMASELRSPVCFRFSGSPLPRHVGLRGCQLCQHGCAPSLGKHAYISPQGTAVRGLTSGHPPNSPTRTPRASNGSASERYPKKLCTSDNSLEGGVSWLGGFSKGYHIARSRSRAP